MIPKSGNRFSEKIMRKLNIQSGAVRSPLPTAKRTTFLRDRRWRAFCVMLAFGCAGPRAYHLLRPAVRLARVCCLARALVRRHMSGAVRP